MSNTYAPINTPGLLEPLEGTQRSDGYLVGKNPLIIGGKKMVDEGIVPITPLKAIRRKCINCSGGSKAEARRCTEVECPCWPFRMGTNPFMRMNKATSADKGGDCDA